MKKNYQAIIFDLGKVLINLDYSRTIKSFHKMGFEGFNFDPLPQELRSFFDLFEKGKVSSQEFRAYLKRYFKKEMTDGEIDTAWNAMLLDVPPERINLLKKLKNKSRIFLLSNTNEIHIDFFSNYINKEYGQNTFSGLFEKEYYSYKMGMRKPDIEIFDHVLKENQLDPGKTLFIDDSPENISGAKKAGIITYHLSPDEDISTIDLLNL
jgi:HAD superfamily hydrolase (TIGR01509 family)